MLAKRSRESTGLEPLNGEVVIITWGICGVDGGFARSILANSGI